MDGRTSGEQWRVLSEPATKLHASGHFRPGARETSMATRKKDPLFGAAVLKLSFKLQGEEAHEGFRFVYDGVLRDLNLTDEQVVRYLEENREAVEAAVRGKVS